MANYTLASLEAALDRTVAAAVDAQEARDEGCRRAGLSEAPPAFFTAAQMIAELCAAHDRASENLAFCVRLSVAELISRSDPNFRDPEFPFFGHRQPTPHEKQLGTLLARAYEAEQRLESLATSGWAATPTATETREAIARGDAVSLASAQRIVEAGRKRRGE